MTLGNLWRLFVRLAAGAVGGGAAVLAAGVYIVTNGPISVSFLTPYLEDALVFEEAGVHVKLGDTVLAWGGWRRNIDLNTLDVQIFRNDGTVLATAPRLSVTFSSAAALRGRLAPLRAELLGAELRFVRSSEGGIALSGLGRDGGQGPALCRLRPALSI